MAFCKWMLVINCLFLVIREARCVSKIGFMPIKDKYSTPDEAIIYHREKNLKNNYLFCAIEQVKDPRSGHWVTEQRPCAAGVCFYYCHCICFCLYSFAGKRCGQYIGACTSEAQQQCKPFLCMDDPRKTFKFSCACPEGWNYATDPSDPGCIDVDECASSSRPCGDRQCINTQGSYHCSSSPAGGSKFDASTPPYIPKGSYTPIDPGFTHEDMIYVDKQDFYFGDTNFREDVEAFRRDLNELAAIYFYKYPEPFHLHVGRPRGKRPGEIVYGLK